MKCGLKLVCNNLLLDTASSYKAISPVSLYIIMPNPHCAHIPSTLLETMLYTHDAVNSSSQTCRYVLGLRCAALKVGEMCGRLHGRNKSCP